MIEIDQKYANGPIGSQVDGREVDGREVDGQQIDKDNWKNFLDKTFFLSKPCHDTKQFTKYVIKFFIENSNLRLSLRELW